MIRKLLAATALLSLSCAPAIARTTHHHHRAAVAVEDTGYYRNVSGHEVHRPAHANSTPPGASARCGDGTYSFSEHHQGTCSHHGGVASWL